MDIELRHVFKTYPGGTTAVRDVCLRVPSGTVLSLIGTSGCGKTTTLEMINRLIEPTRGEISIGGQDVLLRDPITLRRSIGYVIQKGGLFPHMTVAENIGIVAKLAGWSAPRIRARVDELLELVALPPAEYRGRRPDALSGGQQQRVGVARALMVDPPIILMDEPFGALDPITRGALQGEFLRLQRALKKTVVFVTHDLAEAVMLADTVAIMDAGVVRQAGAPEELLARPADDFVAGFLRSHGQRAAPEALTVDDVLDRDVPTLRDDALPPHTEALLALERSGAGAAIVVDAERRPRGVLTRAELEAAEASGGALAAHVKAPVASVRLGAPLGDALGSMFVGGPPVLPVVSDDGVLAGAVTRAALVARFRPAAPGRGPRP